MWLQSWEGWAYKTREMSLLPAKPGARGGRRDPLPGYFGGITVLCTAQLQTSGLQTEKEKMVLCLSLQTVAS